MKWIKIIGGVLGTALLVTGLFSCNVIWRSPGFYKVEQRVELQEPLMDMEAYEDIRKTHRRPYCYAIVSGTGGAVQIAGVEHISDPHHSQLDTIRSLWKEFHPTVALVEGRLGFLFSWFQDPVEQYGEGGLVAQLAKRDGAKLYTWEPTREDEIELLISEFPPERIAMFYAFRPYFSNMRHGKPENPEKKLQGYLESRTDYPHIKGIYHSWEELDSVWRRDFPDIEWRDYSDEYGWPGYLHDVWNSSNLARDFHLVQTIVSLVNKGELVFVTMGVSHAPRIGKALRSAIK